MSHNYWVEIETNFKTEAPNYDLTSNTEIAPQKKTPNPEYNSYESNYLFLNHEPAQDYCESSLSATNQPHDFSIHKLNNQQKEQKQLTSNVLQLDRFNVLNEQPEKQCDTDVQANRKVSIQTTSQNQISCVNASLENLETILQEDLKPFPTDSKLWIHSNIMKFTNSPTYCNNSTPNEFKLSTNNEDEFRLCMSQKEQHPFFNHQIRSPGPSLTPANVNSVERINEQPNIIINPNRATYLGSDGWRSMPQDTEQPSSNDRLDGQEQYPSNYTNLSSVLSSSSHLINPYFYSILDEELTTLPGGPKRWRYLVRELFRADSNIIRADRWRFVVNELKHAHPNNKQTRTTKYSSNYENRPILNDVIHPTSNEEKLPNYSDY